MIVTTKHSPTRAGYLHFYSGHASATPESRKSDVVVWSWWDNSGYFGN